MKFESSASRHNRPEEHSDHLPGDSDDVDAAPALVVATASHGSVAELAREAEHYVDARRALVRPRRRLPGAPAITVEASVAPILRGAQDELPVRVQRRADLIREVAAARVRVEAVALVGLLVAAVHEDALPPVEALAADAAREVAAPVGGGGEGEAVA